MTFEFITPRMRTFGLICFFFILGDFAFAQATKFDKSREFGIIAGTAYYLGEVNPNNHFGTRLKFSGGLSYRNNISKRWTVKASMLYGQVEAWDADSKDPWIVNRNLNFLNQFWEGSLQWELNYTDYQIGNKNHNLSPYLFAGFGYFSMKPQGNWEGNLYELQPLGTEGQGMIGGAERYKTGGLIIPYGVGFKFNLFAVVGMSVEWGFRKTWTDYFDDISTQYIEPNLLENENGDLAATLADQSLVKSGPGATNSGMQRGDPGRKDTYSFALISLNIRLNKKPNNCWG